jgi:predicted MFS family arabinose efflux permease
MPRMPLRHRLALPSPVLFACLFASQSGMLVLSPVLPEIAHDLGVATATAGQLRAVSGAVGGLVAVALALAGRRPGLRTLLSLGAALVAVASLASAAAPSFALLAAAQALLGAGIGLLVSAGIAAAGEWPAPDARPHVLAWAIAGMPAAWIAGMPIVGIVSGAGWRATFVAVPALAALCALALVRLRPADADRAGAAPIAAEGDATAPGAAPGVGERVARTADARGSAVAAWRNPGVARFAGGELLANAAWASVLTYAGALLIGTYGLAPRTAALGLGLTAAAMLPGTFSARRSAAAASRALLAALTLSQGCSVALLCAARPAAVATLALLALMAFVNGWRSMLASAVGMGTSPADKVTAMALRAAANQFGYLLGAAVGGVALALGGFAALGGALALMYAASVLVNLPPLPRALVRARPAEAAT